MRAVCVSVCVPSAPLELPIAISSLFSHLGVIVKYELQTFRFRDYSILKSGFRFLSGHFPVSSDPGYHQPSGGEALRGSGLP